MLVNKVLRRRKIRYAIRKKISGTSRRPRLSVYKSNTAIYAQLIDDQKGVTLLAVNSKQLGNDRINIEIAKEVGSKVAELAKENGVEEVVFDRSGYVYHGKVKVLAENAREGGLKF